MSSTTNTTALPPNKYPGSREYTAAYSEAINQQGASHQDIVDEIGRLEARVFILLDTNRGIAVPAQEWHERTRGQHPQVPIPPVTTASADNRQSEAEPEDALCPTFLAHIRRDTAETGLGAYYGMIHKKLQNFGMEKDSAIVDELLEEAGFFLSDEQEVEDAREFTDGTDCSLTIYSNNTTIISCLDASDMKVSITALKKVGLLP